MISQLRENVTLTTSGPATPGSTRSRSGLPAPSSPPAASSTSLPTPSSAHSAPPQDR
jgi:hypothetical protein